MSTWTLALDEWEAWCRASGHRDQTIANRRWCLQWFADQVDCPPWRVTLRDCVLVLGRPGWAPETRRSYRGALRSFFTWATDLGRVETDPTRKLPTIRVPEVAPRPAGDELLAAALAGATDRDRLILLLAAYAGLRRGEVAGLRWTDVETGGLRVHGKGGKVRVVPLHPALAAELEQEWARRRGGSAGTGYRYGGPDGVWVFPGQAGGSMTPGAVGKAASAALGGRGMHTLRHRFATKAYAVDRDLLAVQVLLGHASPTTTRKYAAVPAGALERAVLAAGEAVAS